MDHASSSPLPTPARGFSSALARGLALLLVAAVATHAAAGDFAALSRSITRGVGNEATSVRLWSLAFARAVRRMAESERSQASAAVRWPTLQSREPADRAWAPAGPAVLASDRVDLRRLDLPPPARA